MPLSFVANAKAWISVRAKLLRLAKTSSVRISSPSKIREAGVIVDAFAAG